MGLLECQYRSEVGVVFVLQVLSAVIGSVVLAVRVHPCGYADSFFGRQLDVVMLRGDVFCQLACICPETVRRQVVIVSGLGVVLADDRDELSFYDVLVRPVEMRSQFTGQIEVAFGFIAAVAANTVCVPDGLDIDLVG